MRHSSNLYSLAIALVLIFHFLFLAHAHQLVSNDLIVDSSGDSMKVETNGCEKERGDCKQRNGNGGKEESMFENEDYIYTQSTLP
ncbi:hypothetical protein A4A49_25184 [Nicotiana attenuata]|uniref:Phytosulfokine-beta n=1 Tax=Nicotiana attenuata TaxID=49451 RepID=A0A1J6K9Z0_NICAT|nr:hypothetical protein A4A49_25184 [Nicotiana attenuata]